MRRTLLLLIAVTAALTVAAAARAGTSVNANGKTYVPATVAYETKTSQGIFPDVEIPATVPYYATKPPSGSYVQVYSPRLKYVVWVPLAAAVNHQWYVAKTGGLSAGWLGVAVIALGLGAGLLVATRKRTG